MKILLFIPLFFILSNNLNSNTHKEKIRRYYNLTSKAENYLMSGELEKSKMLYNKAFKFKAAFVNDFYNYYLLCIETNDDKSVRKAIQYLIEEKGADLSFFINKNNLKPVVDYSWIESNFDIWKNNFINNHNYPLRLEIEKMYRKDQQVRDTKGNPYLENLDSTLYYDSVFYHRFLELCNRPEGFPDEFEIGVWMNDEFFSFYNYFEVLLTHFHSNGGFYYSDRGYSLLKYMEEKVMAGLIPTDLYTITSWQKGKCFFSVPCIGPGDYPIIQINDSLYIQEIADMASIDRYRHQYFMEPLKISIQKGVFQFYNRRYKLNPKVSLGFMKTCDATKKLLIESLNLKLFGTIK